MICIINFTFSFLRDKILKNFPPEYEDGRPKCTVEGCGKTVKDRSRYVSHRGGVHWQGVLDKYLSEEGKDINVDGTWPDKDIKMMEKNKKAKNNDSKESKKDSPVASTPKNGTVKKRGRPPSFNTPDVPCSPTTKKKLKDITVSDFPIFV